MEGKPFSSGKYWTLSTDTLFNLRMYQPCIL